MGDLLVAAGLFVAAFLLGSIPFGLIISKVFYHTDLREHGSGNIGTTNAIRTMGKVGGYAVFVLDFGKGLLSGVLAWAFSMQFLPGGGLEPGALVTYDTMLAVAFLGCVWGHIFCPWLGFKGGKGIAVAVGCLFVTFGRIGACLELLIFIVLVVATKRVSVGSIAAAAACPFFALYFFWGDWLAWLFCTVAGLTVVWAHRENIKRLRAGTESRIGDKGKKKEAYGTHMKIAVIGAGSWGTALAQLLACNGNEVGLWARKPEVVEAVNASHANPRYLSEVELSPRIVATTSYEEALAGAQAAVIVTPSSVMRDVAGVLAEAVDDDFPVIICSKGVEEGSGLLPVEVFEAEMGNASRLAVLSGPNFAAEVIRGIPSGTVIAGSNEETAAFFQQLFASETFRTYVSDDVCGVELCAAFKNVIAIAVGVSYGLGYGDNTAAMLMTRGLAEMSRLVVRCGGQAITCMGLAGTGDLVATCTSEHSRNRRFGKLLAEGGTLEEFAAQTHMVAEGALACKTLKTLADCYDVELPITDVVRSIAWEGADPHDVAKTLTSRPLTTEFYGL